MNAMHMFCSHSPMSSSPHPLKLQHKKKDKDRDRDDADKEQERLVKEAKRYLKEHLKGGGGGGKESRKDSKKESKKDRKDRDKGKESSRHKAPPPVAPYAGAITPITVDEYFTRNAEFSVWCARRAGRLWGPTRDAPSLGRPLSAGTPGAAASAAAAAEGPALPAPAAPAGCATRRASFSRSCPRSRAGRCLTTLLPPGTRAAWAPSFTPAPPRWPRSAPGTPGTLRAARRRRRATAWGWRPRWQTT